MKNKKYNISRMFKVATFLLAVVINLCWILIPKISHAATIDATMFFNPATDSVVDGNELNLVARVDPGSNTVEGINAVQLDVTFNPNVVSLASIAATSPFTIMGSSAISNIDGTLSVALFIEGSEITTISDVATLVFHAQGVGTSSPIVFAGTADAAVNDGNGTMVVGTRTGAAITVIAGEETTPPVLSNGIPSGALGAGTTTTTVGVTTSENATCKYSATAGTAYDAMPNNFTTTGTSTHSFSAAGLSNGNSYVYYVRCKDSSENPTVSDYAISFSISNPSSSSSNNKSSSSDKKKKKKSSATRSISNSKKTLSRGDILIERGKNFSKNSIVALYFSKYGGGYFPPVKVKTSSTGSFRVDYRVNKPKGKYGWYAVNLKTGWKSKMIYFNVR